MSSSVLTNHLSLNCSLLFFTSCFHRSLHSALFPPSLLHLCRAQLQEDLLIWTNKPALSPPHQADMRNMPQWAHIVTTLQTVAQQSPKGAGTQDRTQQHPTAVPDTLSTTWWQKEGEAGMQIHTQSTCCPLEESMGTGTRSMNPHRPAGPEATGVRTQREWSGARKDQPDYLHHIPTQRETRTGTGIETRAETSTWRNMREKTRGEAESRTSGG